MSKHPNEREQLTLFRALPGGDMAPRDAQDLMAYPFFSLAKSRRTAPIHFEAGQVRITVEGVPEHGIATIWDADVLIWAASQIVEARDAGIRPSRLILFGNPPLGVQFLQSNPYSGLDWPVRMLILQEADGSVSVAWTDFGYIAKRYSITDREAQFKMAGEVAASIASSATK